MLESDNFGPREVFRPNLFNLDLGEIGQYRMYYTTDEHLKHTKMKMLFEHILPRMEISVEELKRYIMMEELRSFLPGLPSDKLVSFDMLTDIIERVKHMKPKVEKVIETHVVEKVIEVEKEEKVEEQSKKEYIEELKTQFKLHSIELDDDTVLEVYDYVKFYLE